MIKKYRHNKQIYYKNYKKKLKEYMMVKLIKLKKNFGTTNKILT